MYTLQSALSLQNMLNNLFKNKVKDGKHLLDLFEIYY